MLLRVILCSAVFLLPFFVVDSLAKVVSCEGFVKTKIPGIDLSKVQAKLFTNHGNLKYETECNAQNGHFLIPIYNKGHYVIKVSGPTGWIFSEPNSRAVEIADDGTGCSNDIIVELVGFEIVGEVLNEGGVKLSLGLYTTEKNGGVLVAKTETDGRGHYKFNAKPGVYVISTMTDAGQCVARGTVSVEVTNGPVKVQPDITLAGHNVRVVVVDEWGNKMTGEEGKAAVVDTLVELHSDSQIDFQHLPVNVPRPQTKNTGDDGWTYTVETRTGTALFACLPSARYTFSAAALLRRKDGTQRIGVKFERKTIQLGANAVELTLSVATFRLFGTVLDPLGRPLVGDGVSILLDGVSRPAKGTTASNVGTFELDGVSGGKHRISAAKEHYEIGQAVVDVSTKLDGLIELRTERIAFCGTVSPMASADVSIEVAQLMNNDGGQMGTNAPAITIKPERNGRFCRMLAPGKYTARVISPTAYTPKQQLVNLTEKPLVGVQFTQFLGKIAGWIDCIGTCDGISVELSSHGGGHSSAIIANIKPNESDGTFQFAEISPSIYKVRVVSSENVWWDSTEQTVHLVEKDLDGVHFVQKGFKMDIQSTHPTKMEYAPIVQQKKPSTGDVQQLKTVHLVSGLNTLFFPMPSSPTESSSAKGKRQQHRTPPQPFKFALSSCHDFGISIVADGDRKAAENASNNSGKFTVPGTKRVELVAKATRLPIRIELDGDSTGQGELDMVDINLTCDGCSTGETKLSPISDSINGTVRTFVFRFDQQKVGTQFVATAHSAHHLFIPGTIAIKFNGDCQEEPIVFRAHLGKFIEGHVRPAISEVSVTAKRRKTTGDGKGTDLRTQTDVDGKFRIGPVWDEQDFELLLEKDGFEFKPYTQSPTDTADGPSHRQLRSPFVFSATKLSKLIVRFVDSDLKTPLSDVLVSVSGSSSDFRSNTVTDSTGTLNIVGLAPGTYFIRPILKEYKFTANSFSAQIAEGQTEEMVLEAKRYAYSIYGKVSTISSKMLPSPIYVEALSEQCENHLEDDVVDSSTNEFRVRGLKPSCRYKVFLKAESGEQIKAFPPLFNVQTGNEDRRDVHFVVFPNELPAATVVGELELPANATIGGGVSSSTFRVLLKDSATGKIIQEQNVPGTVFFFTLPAYKKHYAIEIGRSEAKKLKIEPISEEFFADSLFTFVRLIPRPQQRSVDVEVHKANYLGLALILLITLAFLNQTKTKILVEFLMERARKFIRPKNNRQSVQQQIGLSAELERRRKAKKQ
ncbi:hypothetical protein niasHT_024503 [Heterodera trifolii]|uniref:Nodal modulator 1 n=1 Tax=Heterodera trifolii TaxID=157864 RepID=A0ABD2K7J6_9BILA